MSVYGVTTSWKSGEDASARDQSVLVPQEVLGKDDFLRLLVTQLTYQDPLNPVGDQEFIAQLAQFSSLEQMQNVSKGIERLTDLQLWMGGMGQAAALLGRTVVVTDSETQEALEGTVTAARIVAGIPIVVVNDVEYSLWEITEVQG